MDSQTTANLKKLQAYLENLPDTIPICTEVDGTYGFDFFNVDDEDMEDLGVEGAVNRQLEVRLGHRQDGPIIFRERGPGLTEVVTVLESHLTWLSGSAILLKWLDDLIEAAVQAYQKAGCPVSEMSLTKMGLHECLLTTYMMIASECAWHWTGRASSF